MFKGTLTETEVKRLSSNVVALMQYFNIGSNTEMAKKSGLSAAAINRLVKGQMDAPTVGTLRQLGKCFNVYWPVLIERDINQLKLDKVRPESYYSYLESSSYGNSVESGVELANAIEKALKSALMAERAIRPNDQLDTTSLANNAASLYISEQISDRDNRLAISIRLHDEITSARAK